ncbi:peptide-methionine (S)-S-oxide reductase [Muriicola sp.]|uniref:peptide-methionine (S)-S-oxide reductase n=1 Tax=Muriicola sp. TaxID=2020856 RepID=UPI003C73CC66
MLGKIGLGGGCHWCTEAVFQSLLGVSKVKQGWIAAKEVESFSEAIIVYFNDAVLPLEILISIHLHTHSCTSNHSMREKYRSAVYVFSITQKEKVEAILNNFQSDFAQPISTKALFFHEFKENEAQYLDYYHSDPEKPFCENVITPKLRVLLNSYSSHVDPKKINREGG